MNILNKDKTDFSAEVLVQLAIMLECVYAAELIAYKVSGTLDRHGYVGTLFQRRKQCLNNARRKVEAIIRDLEVAFDETFDKIAGCQGEAMERTDFLQAMANDVVELLLIYFARSDGDMIKKQNMKKALLNFKPVKNIDLDAIMEYYKIKL